MRVIELDARGWTSLDEVFDALLPALGAPAWHGRSMNALLDSMGAGAINAVEPPYRIRLVGAETLPAEVIGFLRDLRDYLAARRVDHLGRYGEDREIIFEGLP